jgi:hypothetical protein
MAGDPIYRAIDNRTEELLPALDTMASTLLRIKSAIEEGELHSLLSIHLPDYREVQRLYWEWRTLTEHASYSHPME